MKKTKIIEPKELTEVECTDLRKPDTGKPVVDRDRREALVDIIKAISNYKWSALDNKHTVEQRILNWVEQIEELYN
jgi:hypothetical protein